MPEHPGACRPASSADVTLAEFRAIKVLVVPTAAESARIKVVMNTNGPRKRQFMLMSILMIPGILF